jgi:VIT1/CCC1 family predicted Fe2+/Mn2+ transporter
MLTEEYGLPQEIRSPWLAAVTTFSAFLACGLVPLLPYLFGFNDPLTFSIMMTAGVFFAIGSVKSRWSTAVWWRSGLSTLAVGAIAAGLAYAAGLLLNHLAHQ